MIARRTIIASASAIESATATRTRHRCPWRWRRTSSNTCSHSWRRRANANWHLLINNSNNNYNYFNNRHTAATRRRPRPRPPSCTRTSPHRRRRRRSRSTTRKRTHRPRPLQVRRLCLHFFSAETHVSGRVSRNTIAACGLELFARLFVHMHCICCKSFFSLYTAENPNPTLCVFWGNGSYSCASRVVIIVPGLRNRHTNARHDMSIAHTL